MAETQELATRETTEIRVLTPDEIEEFKGLTREEIDKELSDRPSENPSVDRCIRAFNRAAKKERARIAADEDAEDDVTGEPKSSYLCNMPPLDSFENVRDFIACVTFAEVAGIIPHYETENYLSSARVALAAVRHERKPRQNEPKRLGRPPKTPPTEENK